MPIIRVLMTAFIRITNIVYFLIIGYVFTKLQDVLIELYMH